MNNDSAVKSKANPTKWKSKYRYSNYSSDEWMSEYEIEEDLLERAQKRLRKTRRDNDIPEY
jgi:hypothetical protein